MPKLSLNASKKTKQTAAGEIPVDWECAKLERLIDKLEAGVSVSGSDRPAARNEQGVLKVSAVSDGRFLPDENKAIETSEILRARLRPRVGAILVSRSNSPELVGESALIKETPGNLFLPDKLWQVQLLKNANASEEWLSQVLRLPTIRLEMRNRASGTSQSMKNISKSAFLGIHVALPPLPEQRKIADILTTWDEALEKLDALIAAKDRRKKALMQQLLTGKMRLGSDKAPWPVVRLGDVAKNVADANKGRMGGEQLYGVTKADGVVPMREHVKGANFARCKHVEPNWFAYNPMRINIGSIARWQGDQTVMVSGDYVVFRCLEKKLLPAYLDHFRQTERWQYFMKVAGNGSVRVRIYFRDLAELRFPCPPIKEQKAIADVLDTCDAELTLLRRQRDALDVQKRGLMQCLLTGKIRVTV